MQKSALGLAVSLLALVFSAPAAWAERAPAVPAKKEAHKKTPVKHKAGAKPAAAKAKPAKAARKPHVNRSSKKTAATHAGAKAPRPAVAASAVPAAAAMHTAGELAGLHATRDPLALASNAALVLDQSTSQVLFEKNSSVALPIASLTKLMTALVVVEARQNMDETLEVTADDIDREKNTGSRLRVGAQLSRADMLHIALMSSENRAASALGRNYPGGLKVFVAAMNAKAKALGMTDSRFVEPTGLSSSNMSSARDLAKLVVAAYQHPTIREYSTDTKYVVDTGGALLQYINSNQLVRNPNSDWEIGLQKTGYISEAGRCLVMQAKIDQRQVVMVFLDSKSKQGRIADAGRIRKWLEDGKPQIVQVNAHQS